MQRKHSLIVLLLLAMLVAGCNIFSPFSSGDKDNDPQALLSEAQSQLKNNNPKEALTLLERAKQLSPQTPTIRYFHAVATIRAYNVNFEAFIDALQQSVSGGSANKGWETVAAVTDTFRLFDFTEAELQNLLNVFAAVKEDLDPVVAGLINGTIKPEEFQYANDAYLSCGVAALVYGFVLMLDQDHNAANGFILDPRISLTKVQDVYQIFVDDPSKTANQICREVDSIIEANYPPLEDGLRCLWYYYHDATFGQLPAGAPPVPPTAMPSNIRNTPSGEFFKVVYSGLEALKQFGCS